MYIYVYIYPKRRYTPIYFHIPSHTFIYPHMLPSNIQHYKYEGQHDTQKWSYLEPQTISNSENLTQCFLVSLQRVWYTQMGLKYIHFMCFKRSGGILRGDVVNIYIYTYINILIYACIYIYIQKGACEHRHTCRLLNTPSTSTLHYPPLISRNRQ